jgi:hypothetical protein
LEPVDRERVSKARDAQLDRATDLLKGVILFSSRAPATEGSQEKPGKMAAK